MDFEISLQVNAVAAVMADPAASYLAGGTTQIDLMKDGVLGSTRLIDISRLPLRGITRETGVLRIGALTTMKLPESWRNTHA